MSPEPTRSSTTGCFSPAAEKKLSGAMMGRRFSQEGLTELAAEIATAPVGASTDRNCAALLGLLNK